MKRTILMFSLLSMAPGLLYAQAGRTDRDLDSELDQIAASRTTAIPANGANATIAPQGGNGGRSIYIVNQATPSSSAQNTSSQGSVQKQQQVDISATPLQKSRAEQIREARQQAEVDTENRVVEKLEVSRIEDEKRRAAVLFGEPFNELSQTQNTNIRAQNVNLNQQTQAVQNVGPSAPVAVIAPPVQPAPPPPVQPIIQPIQYVAVPVIEHREHKEERDEDDRDDHRGPREEVRADIRKLEEHRENERSMGVFLGMGDYPDVSNVRGNYSLGVNYGTVFGDTGIMVQGEFMYADYTVNDINSGGTYDYRYGTVVPSLVDMRQYSGSISAKYVFLDGMIRPMVGGLGQYSYRTFTWENNQGGYASGYGSGSNSGNGGDANSSALDVGVTAGVDFALSHKFTLGFEMRYLWNVANRVNQGSNAGWFDQSPYFGTPIEKLQYYTMGVTGRVNF